MKAHFSRKSIGMASAVVVFAGVVVSQLILPSAKAQPGYGRHFVLDVAEDCNTARINPVDPNENTATDVSPADTIVVAGNIFPGGTLKSGTQNNLPSDVGSVGQWVSRAVFLVNTSQFLGGVSPIADATMLYLLPNSSSSLVSEGLVPNVGSAEVRAVIGGTGPFAGVTGEVRHENIGTNATGCFNYRFTFQVKD